MTYRRSIGGIYQVADHNPNGGNAEITKSASKQKEDAKKTNDIKSPCKTDGTKEIQDIIKQLQNDITNIQKFSGRFSTVSGAVSALVNEDSGIGKDIKRIVDFATTDISTNIKTMLGPIRAWVLTEIEKRVKKVLPFLFPSEVPSFVNAWRQGTNLILCAFAKILGLLFSNIGSLLLQFIDRFINGPLCAIEDFLSKLFSSILQPIIDAINSALSLITGVIGNLASSLFNALGFINELINFFKCETSPKCPTQDRINLAGNGLFTKSTPISISPQSTVGYGTTGIGTLPNRDCPTNPIPCGPPKIQFFGGGGSGAAVNPIISRNSSSIIGFDIVNPGEGFLQPPTATIVDDCGKGSGASLLVRMQPSTAIGSTINGIGSTSIGTLEIKEIVILSPGDGFIASPDGSLGGNGIVWKDVDEGYVIKEDGSLYVVPDGNEPPNLPPGDTFIPPEGSSITPPGDSLTYPVVLSISDVYIQDGGFGYSPGDTMEVIPNKGAELEPIINELGQIEGINIINSGTGFTDIPEININSINGFNAKLIPILKSTRLDEINPFDIPPGTEIVSVVDCVGKIPPKSTFNRLPR